MDDFLRTISGIVLFVFVWVGLALERESFAALRTLRQLERLPVSEIRSVLPGEAMLEGTVVAENPLSAPYSSRPCVYYRYIVKKQSAVSGQWPKIEDREHFQRSSCVDDSGSIPVSPSRATVIPARKDKKTTKGHQYIENSIREGDEVYVLGSASVDPDTKDSLIIKASHQTGLPFIVSNLSEWQITVRKAFYGMLSLNVAFSAITLVVFILAGLQGSFSPISFLMAGTAGPAMLAMVAIALHHDDLVSLRRQVQRYWANLEVSLEKRHDLQRTHSDIPRPLLSKAISVPAPTAANCRLKYHRRSRSRPW